jgi:hypothetical protein
MSGWIKIEDAPLETRGFIWTPEKTWDDRTDQTGVVHDDGEGGRHVSSHAQGWKFTHWHPLIRSPAAVCPFENPATCIDLDVPCPVCGALGSDESADVKCVDR